MDWRRWMVSACLAALALTTSVAVAQFPTSAGVTAPPAPSAAIGEAAVVDLATQVLGEIMATPASAIPKSMLADAQAIAVLPRMTKGGFVVGVRHGRGILVSRAENGGWVAPTFITITGGSIGWQAGIESTDLVLVFKTKHSLESLATGKFTIGAGVSAAAGPVGREASLGTDVKLQAEIYSYSRSRGIFAGAALDGSALQVDQAATARYYAAVAPASNAQVAPAIPPSAMRFLDLVSRYAGANRLVPPPEPAPAGSAATLETLTPALLRASASLQPLLDERWREYLALPAELQQPGGKVDSARLAVTMQRYQTVAADARYHDLSGRVEFQQTLDLLRQYSEKLTAQATLPLPPPPPQ
ncbi:MAG: lipid-binding SYLF domain-containing protein [Pirellulales bacterium]|nr:lipid-binding SYLF domain-containing protein [Pirellulales bacterium]